MLLDPSLNRAFPNGPDSEEAECTRRTKGRIRFQRSVPYRKDLEQRDFEQVFIDSEVHCNRSFKSRIHTGVVFLYVARRLLQFRVRRVHPRSSPGAYPAN